MAEFPALPLFTDAIIADCSHLSDAEFGLYVRLLILIWRSPDCEIPNDMQWISRKLRSAPESVSSLVDEFCDSDGNYLTQKRLQKELYYLREKSKKQSVRSNMRWNKEKVSSRGNAAPHGSGNAPTPTPTPTPIKEKNTKKEEITHPDFDRFWKYFPKQRAGNREKALIAFLSAQKRATTTEILNGLTLYINSQEVADGFAKGAAAWLNDDRWASTYEMAVKKADTGFGRAGL